MMLRTKMKPSTFPISRGTMIVRTMNSRISIDLVVKSGVKRHGYIEMEMVDRLRHPVVLWEYHRQPHIFVVDEHCPTIRKGHGIYIDIYIYIGAVVPLIGESHGDRETNYRKPIKSGPIDGLRGLP